MNKEFVMRGQTASGGTEVLNFSGNTPGYAYRIIDFQLYPSTNIGGAGYEFVGSITAGKTAVAPTDPNFDNDGLIATAWNTGHEGSAYTENYQSIVNDTFLITQDLILMVQDTGGANNPVNWHCRFVAEKMSTSEEAVTNYHQFTISNDD
jgi:hypothetical protein